MTITHCKDSKRMANLSIGCQDNIFNGKLKEEVYFKHLEGFIISGKEK